MSSINSVTYANTSFYYNTPQVSKNGVNYLGMWSSITIAPASTDSLITLPSKYNLRPDSLSYDLYGTSQLYWVFMLRNPDVIQDPIWDFISGINIYVPAQSSLTRYL